MRRDLRLSLLAALGALVIVATTLSTTTAAFGAQFAPAASGTCTPARPHLSGSSTETIATSDGQRTYILHVPPSYTGGTSVPLVLDIHGATSNASSQELYSGFSAKADTAGFIVVYPQGLTTAAIPYTHFNAWMLPVPSRTTLGS
jgi:poly(3-hydroxybutyrate) depolymerase